MIDLIFCAHGNRNHAQHAVNAGWLYGSQPRTVYFDVSFADSDYKRDDRAYRERFLRFLSKHRPKYAVVPDVYNRDDLPETLKFAARMAKYCSRLVIVPKAVNLVQHIPEMWGDRPVILGYSVPTSHGATPTPDFEFMNWKYGVHLLGGSPHKQLEIAMHLPVVSADCNYHQRMAFWGKWWSADKRLFVEDDPREMPSEEWFRLSCEQIKLAWDKRIGLR